MSVLLVDVGNSRLKWRLQKDALVVAMGVAETAHLASLPVTWRAWPAPLCAVVSCVAGEAARRSLTHILHAQGTRITWVAAKARAHGVLNGYARPEQLGTDRYAALVAVARAGLGDAVVVAAGTALTVDGLTRDGDFLGGCILPGPALMRDALARGTGAVRAAQVEAATWPRDTASAVATGIALAMQGVVATMRERLARQVGREPIIVLTGGARAALRDGLPTPWLEREHLILEGLAWIARDLTCDA